jgi:subtilisin-like proprotein convertase family protein
MQRVLLLTLILILATPVVAQEQSGKISLHLEQALTQSPPGMVGADGTWGVWVFFRDKALSGEALNAALDDAERDFPERTLRRRAKVKAPGARLVDTGDLPLSVEYLAAVIATGAQPRKQSLWLNAASFDATAAQIGAIADLPFVDGVSLVAQFFRPEPQVSPEVENAGQRAREKAAAEAADRWTLDYGGSTAGLEQINVPPVHEMGLSGSGVIVAMLDSGFRTTHNALRDIPVVAQWDFVDDDPIVDEEEGDPLYSARHGTQTMSTLMGFYNGELVGPAYQASVILARTEDIGDETPIEEDNWVAGLEWAELQGADLVSSSLGYYYWYEFSDLDGNTAVTTVAGDAAVARGLGVFTSAGNERDNPEFPHLTAPADGDSIVAMAAVTLDGDIASFSSPGPTFDGRIKPDVSAQGVSNFVASYYNDSNYHTADGTSFACPLVAGVAALILERIPSLTPIQVREALRQTADRAANPDNDYGWGIIDAHAAVTYWGPNIVHEPLGDTENIIGPYPVTATITDREPLDPGALYLFWRLDGGPWSQVALLAVGGDQYTADIPGQATGGLVEYYLEAGDTSGITLQMPHGGPDNAWSFAVGPDSTAPELFHPGLTDQTPATWGPALVIATAADNLGLDRVELTYSRNGGPSQGPFLLTPAGDFYEMVFPLLAVQVGDEVTYELIAYDTAAVPNQAFSGPHTFFVKSNLGTLLVIDDNPLGLSKDDGGDPALEINSSAADMANWLGQAGYEVDAIESSQVAPGGFLGYDALVFSSGNYSFPIGDAMLRQHLIDWVNDGGRILLEGGALTEVAGDPWGGYPEFAATVLRAAEWWGDFYFDAQFIGAAGQEQHPVLTRPHFFPQPVTVNLSGLGYDFGASDAVLATPEAQPVLRTIYNNQTGGVIVYDDNTGPEAGQSVYFTFDITYMDESVARDLTLNAMAYLLAREAPGNASISGTVALADNQDASGVTVSAGGDHSVVTGPDGQYTLDGLHGSTYTVTATLEGYGPGSRTVVLGADEQRSNVDFILQPVLEIQASVDPMLPIPDNDPVGVSSTITIGEEGHVFDISVDIDISHPSIGQLVVTLTSPNGTVVHLHNLTGSISDDIVGNWPGTLSVDGPGALEDYLDENVQGVWTLNVADTQFGAWGGVLNSWGLNILAGPSGISATPEDLPQFTRIAGNAPNPFNPQTTIAFELAHSSEVQLDVFDLRGRHVRQLVSEIRDAGYHRVVWDGRDDGHRGTASGVYFCRLLAEGSIFLHKMMLVR